MLVFKEAPSSITTQPACRRVAHSQMVSRHQVSPAQGTSYGDMHTCRCFSTWRRKSGNIHYVRFGVKTEALALLQEWVRDVGSHAGLNGSNTRIMSGAIGCPESRLEVRTAASALQGHAGAMVPIRLASRRQASVVRDPPHQASRPEGDACKSCHTCHAARSHLGQPRGPRAAVGDAAAGGARRVEPARPRGAA